MSVKAVKLEELVDYCDGYLGTGEVVDWDGAKNGLQVENVSGEVKKIGAAVDANVLTFRAAVDAGVDFLLVHHGLFWGEVVPLTGVNFEKVRLLLENGVALYGSHLPLDLHDEVGNNVILAGKLGVEDLELFGEAKGQLVGRVGNLKESVGMEDFVKRVESILGGACRVLAGGGMEREVRRVAVVTGGAADSMELAREAGADVFLTGEGAHHTFGLAHEAGMNVIYGGHYATEVFGVKALAEHLAGRFGLGWEFLDVPSGL